MGGSEGVCVRYTSNPYLLGMLWNNCPLLLREKERGDEQNKYKDFRKIVGTKISTKSDFWRDLLGEKKCVC